jgi:hypothetical protein
MENYQESDTKQAALKPCLAPILRLAEEEEFSLSGASSTGSVIMEADTNGNCKTPEEPKESEPIPRDNQVGPF